MTLTLNLSDEFEFVCKNSYYIIFSRHAELIVIYVDETAKSKWNKSDGMWNIVTVANNIYIWIL